MFGDKGERRSAHAVVLSARKALPGSGAGRYRVHARVEPEGEPFFEAKFSVHASSEAEAPHEGQRIPVTYVGDDVEWDRDAMLGERAAKRATDRERRERIAAERREQGLPPVEADDTPDLDLEAKLRALQERKDRGELNDWDFRVARSELFKDAGF